MIVNPTTVDRDLWANAEKQMKVSTWDSGGRDGKSGKVIYASKRAHGLEWCALLCTCEKCKVDLLGIAVRERKANEETREVTYWF